MVASTERICKCCGESFIRVVRAAQKYCSPECRRSFWNKTFYKQGYVTARHNKNPEKMMLRSAKHRAKKKGLPFDITVEDIIVPEYCPVLKIKLEANGGTGGAKRNSPSLDRIIPELGYVKGNVQVISNAANLLKGNSTPEDMILFAEWVIENYKETQLEE